MTIDTPHEERSATRIRLGYRNRPIVTSGGCEIRRSMEQLEGRPASSPALRVQLLGRFRVWVGLRPVPETAWRRRKAAALVKLLALAPEHRLHREEALETLWPELLPE